MILEVLPDSLYSKANINTLLSDKNNSIIYKTLDKNLIDKKMYLSSLAILYIVKGKQVIQSYDGGSIVVQQGQMVALSKDLYLVSDFVTEKGTFEAMIFFIGYAIVEKYIVSNGVNKKTNASEHNSVSKIEATKQITEYVRSIQCVYQGVINNSALLELKLLELLHLIDQEGNNSAFLLSLNTFSKKRNIKKFMESNYLNNLKIDDYAALTGRSVSTFIRDFKRLYDITPNKWLISKRLKKAQALLGSTSLNVTEVSMEVGYENVSHFISAYRSKYGLTPKQEQSKKID